MRNFDHVMDRVEREIEEIMGEKKWTPQHAKALEELLMCEKCVKEIEKLAHAKKRMMGLPAPTEEEDEEMMEQPWHFNYARRGNYNRGGNYERSGNYTRDNYSYMPPMDYHYSPYMEEEMMDPMMRRKMMKHPYMYGGNQYTYGWDPMMEERESWKMRRPKGRYEEDDDDDEKEKRKMRGNYEHNANSVGTPSTASQDNGATTTAGAAKPR